MNAARLALLALGLVAGGCVLEPLRRPAGAATQGAVPTLEEVAAGFGSAGGEAPAHGATPEEQPRAGSAFSGYAVPLPAPGAAAPRSRAAAPQAPRLEPRLMRVLGLRAGRDAVVLREALEGRMGVAQVEVDVTRGVLRLLVRPDFDEDAVRVRISELGYRAPKPPRPAGGG